MSRAEAVAKGQEGLCGDGIRCAFDELPWRWMLAVLPRRPRATGARCCATGPCAEGWRTAAEPREGTKKLSGDGRSLCCAGDGDCVVAVLPWRSLSGARSRLSGGALGGKLKEKQQGHCGQVPAALGPHTPVGLGCGHGLAGAGEAVTSVKLTLGDELLAQAWRIMPEPQQPTVRTGPAMRWRRAPAELARRLFGDGRSSLMSDGAVGQRLAPDSRAAAGVAQRRR